MDRVSSYVWALRPDGEAGVAHMRSAERAARTRGAPSGPQAPLITSGGGCFIILLVPAREQSTKRLRRDQFLFFLLRIRLLKGIY